MYSLYIIFSHNLCIYKNINVWTYSDSIIYIRLFEIKILKKKETVKNKKEKKKGPY